MSIYFAIPPGDRLGNHVNTAEETQYILSGTGDLLLDDGAKPVKPGDVFVLNEGTAHDLHNTGPEELRVLASFSKPTVEQHWDIETWPPDDTKVTGSPNGD
jgi:quercetin dioxygenase-like cupin family protein